MSKNYRYLKWDLDNQFGPLGDFKHGKKRNVTFVEEKDKGRISVHVVESIGHNKCNGITSETTNYDGAVKHKISRGLGNFNSDGMYVSREQVIDYIYKIFSHPRTKETMDYLEKELEKVFPGIIQFIINNLGYEYEEFRNMNAFMDDSFINYYDAIIMDKCNLDGKQK